MTVTYHRKTHHSKCSKCLLLALRHAIKQSRHWSIDWSISSAGCWPYFNQMLFQHMDIPHWFLINMFLHFGFSRCLQVLVHWCGFQAARGDSDWCILLWCLAAHTVAAIHLSSCWWLLLSSAPHMHKSTELLWHKTPDFTPDMRPPNRPDLNPVDYGIWTVIQECIYHKQQLSSYITDKL